MERSKNKGWRMESRVPSLRRTEKKMVIRINDGKSKQREIRVKNPVEG